MSLVVLEAYYYDALIARSFGLTLFANCDRSAHRMPA
jgi:hypothetical protein